MMRLGAIIAQVAVLNQHNLQGIFRMCYIGSMEWEIEFSDEFERWWNSLTEDEQESVNTKVILLQKRGPALGRPHADVIQISRHSNMKELIVQHHGRPLRILFVFDPNRCGQLLVGGDKTGDDRWYDKNVPIADNIYDRHLAEIGAAKER